MKEYTFEPIDLDVSGTDEKLGVDYLKVIDIADKAHMPHTSARRLLRSEEFAQLGIPVYEVYGGRSVRGFYIERQDQSALHRFFTKSVPLVVAKTSSRRLRDGKWVYYGSRTADAKDLTFGGDVQNLKNQILRTVDDTQLTGTQAKREDQLVYLLTRAVDLLDDLGTKLNSLEEKFAEKIDEVTEAQGNIAEKVDEVTEAIEEAKTRKD